MNQHVLLILGASSDCGIAVIRKLHTKYIKIYAHFNHESEALNTLKRELGDKIILVQDDFSDSEGGKGVIKEIEQNGIWPDHVIHFPAPAYQNQKFIKCGWEPFERGIWISLHSCVVILQSVIAKLVKTKKEGRILFMLSSYTDNIPPKYSSPYITVKYSLLGLMKELSAEYVDKGIMVNGISPGMMETKFLADVPELIIQQNAAASPFGRNLNVDEVVPLFEFMLSDEAARITGQNIVISGGI